MIVISNKIFSWNIGVYYILLSDGNGCPRFLFTMNWKRRKTNTRLAIFTTNNCNTNRINNNKFCFRFGFNLTYRKKNMIEYSER